MRPDFQNFKGVGVLSLCHSAKGSTWEKHKYVKVVNGNYYYPNGYSGGRHLSSLSDLSYYMKGSGSKKNDTKEESKSSSAESNNTPSENTTSSSSSTSKSGKSRVAKALSGSAKTKKVSEVSDSDVKEVEKFVSRSGMATTAKGINYQSMYRISRQKPKHRKNTNIKVGQ